MSVDSSDKGQKITSLEMRSWKGRTIEAREKTAMSVG